MKINTLSAILIAVLIIVLCLFYKSCSDSKQYERMAIDKNDTLLISRNVRNQQIATIDILQGSNSALQKLNSSKDSLLHYLQTITDSHTISSDILSNSTSNSITSNSVSISYLHDTIKKDSLIYIFPVYTTNYSNNWEKFEVDASHTFIKIKYKVFNDFNIITRYNKPTWYKMRVPEITVTNANPNTETLELKSFVVSPPKNQKLFIFLGGLLSGTIATAYISTKLK